MFTAGEDVQWSLCILVVDGNISREDEISVGGGTEGGIFGTGTKSVDGHASNGLTLIISCFNHLFRQGILVICANSEIDLLSRWLVGVVLRVFGLRIFVKDDTCDLTAEVAGLESDCDRVLGLVRHSWSCGEGD